MFYYLPVIWTLGFDDNVYFVFSKSHNSWCEFLLQHLPFFIFILSDNVKTIFLGLDYILLKDKLHVLLIFAFSTLLWTHYSYQYLLETCFLCITETKKEKRRNTEGQIVWRNFFILFYLILTIIPWSGF